MGLFRMLGLPRTDVAAQRLPTLRWPLSDCRSFINDADDTKRATGFIPCMAKNVEGVAWTEAQVRGKKQAMLKRFLFDYSRIHPDALHRVKQHVKQRISTFYALLDGAPAKLLKEWKMLPATETVRCTLAGACLRLENQVRRVSTALGVQRPLSTNTTANAAQEVLSSLSSNALQDFLDLLHEEEVHNNSTRRQLGVASACPPHASKTLRDDVAPVKHSRIAPNFLGLAASKSLNEDCALEVGLADAPHRMTVLFRKCGSDDPAEVESNFIEMCRLSASSFVEDASRLSLQNVSQDNADLLPPKYLLQLSGTVYSLYLIEPLTSNYFFVLRLLRNDMLEGVLGHQRQDDHFAQWFPDAPNLHESAEHSLPEPGLLVSDTARSIDRNHSASHDQSIPLMALAMFPALHAVFAWAKLREPSHDGVGVKVEPIPQLDEPTTQSCYPVAVPSDVEAKRDGDWLSRYGLVDMSVKQRDMNPRQGSAKHFWAVDPNMFDLRQSLYDHANSKVWAAVRRVDGAEVVVKWCTRKSTFRTLQAYLALNGKMGIFRIPRV